MSYDDWLRSLDRALKSSGRDSRVRDLDPDELRKAFEAGTSPVAFSKNTSLPRRNESVKPVRLKPTFMWLPFALLVVLGAMGYRYVRDVNLARAGADRLEQQKSWPVDLPLKTDAGPYYPAGADEAEDLATDHAKSLLIQPSAATFSKVSAIRYGKDGSFQVDGYVDAPNEYNTRVNSRWSIWVLKRGEKTDFRVAELESTKNSSVWKSPTSGLTNAIPEKEAPSKAAGIGGRHSHFVSTFMNRSNEKFSIISRSSGVSGEGTQPFPTETGKKLIVWTIPSGESATRFKLTLTNKDTQHKVEINCDVANGTQTGIAISGTQEFEALNGTHFIDVDTDASKWQMSILQGRGE